MEKEDEKEQIFKIKKPDKIGSYFRLEKIPLLFVAVSGIVYNIGMTAGPYFEGRLVQCLLEVMRAEKTWKDMLLLALLYLAVILIVQGARCFKRFYVRRFANDTGRNMRRMLYNSLVYKSRQEMEKESVGEVMTKAVADVDACVEGMRKFTTEIFDTGVVLIAYLVMLFYYDWRLTLLSCMFVPLAYQTADSLKKTVTRYHAEYKKSAGRLNDATMDRVSNALTYRVYGLEANRNTAYHQQLADYEKRAAKANVWETSMKPIYHIISMCGVIPLLYFGGKNVLGTGWTSWNIAAFTTFLSCFTKMAAKSSSAAKLFNAMQKAQVSWKRIKPFMQEYVEPDKETKMDFHAAYPLKVSHLSFAYPQGETVIQNLSFEAEPGEIIGITGLVASGKSTLGKVFLCEYPYEGEIRMGDYEISALSPYERSQLISYLGHAPELMSETLEENIRLGERAEAAPYLEMVKFEEEIEEMPEGMETYAGSGGGRLSGGQQARIALARTLYNGKKLLILDDPFSAVDKKTEMEIMDNIRKFAKDRIVLLISHRLSLFPEFDRIIWLEKGGEKVGTHTELMQTNELYAQLYRAQRKGGDLDEE